MGPALIRPLTISLLAAALIAGACSSSMSTADYVVEAEAAAVDYNSATGALRAAYTEALREPLEAFAALNESLETREIDESDTARLAAETQDLVNLMVLELGRVYDGAGAALSNLIARMDQLDPPSELADAHDAYVATLNRSLESIPGLIDGMVGARTLRDIDAQINSSDFGDTQPRVAATCVDLEQAAAVRGHALDLRCGDIGDL